MGLISIRGELRRQGRLWNLLGGYLAGIGPMFERSRAGQCTDDLAVKDLFGGISVDVEGGLGIVGGCWTHVEPAIVWLKSILNGVGPGYEGQLEGCWGGFGEARPQD